MDNSSRQAAAPNLLTSVNSLINMKKNKKMTDYAEKLKLLENGGRRFMIDRRQLSYTLYIPERRSGIDRRSGKDRRKEPRLNSRLYENNL